MAPDAAETNAPSGPNSGMITETDVDAPQWSPETVLSTLKQRPQSDTESPIPFFHTLERLKTTKREGWRRFGIDHGESISDHMYRMSILTMFAPASLSSRINIPHCTKMALIHDMAEALVGDITPVDKVSKEEKSRREGTTMDYFCKGLLGRVGGGLTGEDVRRVWQEYEDSETLESKYVHDIDKVELLLQMTEYERSKQGELDLGEFTRVAAKVVLPEMKVWADQLLEERRQFWKGVGKEPSYMNGSP
ncbi:hypothetical protein K490DRAFT_70676 [Saccharata proteae CBS 121410]|uniref:5'-deoxynucleotidase n=1 Tax=Saccharata proteae CBS 121410 TaxID=1314787 RepID=A0A9P4M075_9PEZI|nr:hypothetical protein K490DRAFT_70676 [Saccharata proteae CBS 121410]